MFVKAASEDGKQSDVCSRRDSDRVRIETGDNFSGRDDFSPNDSDLRVGRNVNDDRVRSPEIGVNFDNMIVFVPSLDARERTNVALGRSVSGLNNVKRASSTPR